MHAAILIMDYLNSEAMGVCFKMAPIIRFGHILQMFYPDFALPNRREDAFCTGSFSYESVSSQILKLHRRAMEYQKHFGAVLK